MGKRDINPMEELVDRLVTQLTDTVEAMPESPPFGAVRLTQAEQLERYEKIRDNDQAWGKLIEEHSVDECLLYAEKMEKLRAKENE